MAKRVKKVKEPIKVRTKKLANGNHSIYLDIYRDGKREYEFLKQLYLIPETAKEAKEANEATLKLAYAIKAKRIVELQNNEHGFSNAGLKSKIRIFDYISQIAKEKQAKQVRKIGGEHQILNALMWHLKEYKGDKVTFKHVDKDYIKGFVNYLKTAKNRVYKESDKEHDYNGYLSPNSQYNYFKYLSVCINKAFRDEIIPMNPLHQLKSEDTPKKQESSREYLTIDEIKRLSETDCIKPMVKNAFLFACFTGLRFSDIRSLKWGDFHTDNNGDTFIQYRQIKTQKQEYLQISNESLKWLPERGTSTNEDNVFVLSTNGYTNLALKSWVLSTGVSKQVTFHVARHTNATLLLSLGVPIETVSKLLGHSEIKTTQIYAKVIDKSKRDAVNKLNGIFDKKGNSDAKE